MAKKIEDLGRELTTLREVVGNFGKKRVDEIAEGLVASVIDIKKTLSAGLTTLPAEVAKELALVKLTADDVNEAVKGLRDSLSALESQFAGLLATIAGSPSTPTGSLASRTNVYDLQSVEALKAIEKQLRTISSTATELNRSVETVQRHLESGIQRRPRFPWWPFVRTLK